MKYHIDFDNGNRISFEILDTPIAQTWATMLKESLESEDVVQQVTQESFPGVRKLAYYRNLSSYYNQLKEMNIVEDLFTYKDNLNDFKLEDYVQLDRDVEYLYLKAVRHNNYYLLEENVKNQIVHLTKRIKQYKEGLMDCVFNPSECYMQVDVNSAASLTETLDDSLRSEYWVQNARPSAVIRIHPDEDIRSLNKAYLRHNLMYYQRRKSAVTYSTPKHRICFYASDLSDEYAENFMYDRRSKMLDFVVKNNLNIVPGESANYNFVEPVVAHLISDEKTLEEYFNYIGNSPVTDVTITLED